MIIVIRAFSALPGTSQGTLDALIPCSRPHGPHRAFLSALGAARTAPSSPQQRQPPRLPAAFRAPPQDCSRRRRCSLSAPRRRNTGRHRGTSGRQFTTAQRGVESRSCPVSGHCGERYFLSLCLHFLVLVALRRVPASQIGATSGIARFSTRRAPRGPAALPAGRSPRSQGASSPNALPAWAFTWQWASKPQAKAGYVYFQNARPGKDSNDGTSEALV